MLSSAAAQPPPGAPPQQQGLGGSGGADVLAAQLSGFARSGSAAGLSAQAPPTQAQLQHELLGGGSRGPSPAGSLTNTPRTLSGLSAAETTAAGSGKGWSSLDGMARPNWQHLGAQGGNPADVVLGGGGAAGIPRPPSAGPPPGALSSSYDGGGGMSRTHSGASPNPLAGLPNHLQMAGQQQLQRLPSNPLPNGLPGNAAQQQLLQQHLAQQQRSQGMLPGYGQQQQHQSQSSSLANLQAAAQAAQAAQAANMRQQALLRNVSPTAASLLCRPHRTVCMCILVRPPVLPAVSLMLSPRSLCPV